MATQSASGGRPGKRAVGYVRVSTKTQAAENMESLPSQRRKVDAFAGQNDLDVIDIVAEDETATSLVRRLQLQSILRRARTQRDFEHLIVLDVKRFTRGGSIHLFRLFDQLEAAGVQVRFIDLDIAHIPFGKPLLAFLADMAKEDNADRKKYALERKVERVHTRLQPIPGRNALYGYQWGPEHHPNGALMKLLLVVDERVAPVVRRIFRDIDAGVPLTELARRLNDEGIPCPSKWAGSTKHGQGWYLKTIRDIIWNPAYYGEMQGLRHAYTERSDEDFVEKNLISRYEHAWRDASQQKTLPPEVCPPIVDKDLALRCQARLTQNRELSPRGASRYTLAEALCAHGIVRCLNCRRAMGVHPEYGRRRGEPRGGPVWTYICTHTRPKAPNRCDRGSSIRTHELDEHVWQTLVRAMRDQDYLRRCVEQTDELFSAAHDIERLEKRVVKLDISVGRAQYRLDGLGPDDPDYEGLYASTEFHLRQLVQERQGLQDELDSQRRREARNAERRAALAQVQQIAEQHGDLDTLTAEEKRAILEGLHIRVYVGRPPGWRIRIVMDLRQDAERSRHVIPQASRVSLNSNTGIHTLFEVLRPEGDDSPTPTWLDDESTWSDDMLARLDDEWSWQAAEQAEDTDDGDNPQSLNSSS